jgi:hypothetical protein
MNPMETNEAMALQEAIGIIWSAQCNVVGLGDYAWDRLKRAKTHLEKQLAEYFAVTA